MRERGQHSPLVGFNSNVRYRGHTFHIQTEDSGRARPHLTTLLFADGGHIIASHRSEYAALLGEPNWERVVKKRMQDQHRAVLRELMSGSLDEKIIALLGPIAPRSRPASHTKSSEGAPLSARPAGSEREADNVPAQDAVPPLTLVARGRDHDHDLLGLGSLVDPLIAITEKNHPGAQNAVAPQRRDGPGNAVSEPIAAGRAKAQVPPLNASHALSTTGETPATRPAAIFEANESSLFGLAELNQDSLNDVILSFISQELESDK